MRLCEGVGLRVHLDIRVCGGGDSLAVVSFSVKQYRKRSKQFGKYSSGLILLDDDRIEEDKRHGRDPFAGLAGEDLSLVRLVPNFEGLLLRLHPGYENRTVSKQTAKRDLQRKWPEYEKGIIYLTIQSTLFYAVGAANATQFFQFSLRSSAFPSGLKNFPSPVQRIFHAELTSLSDSKPQIPL